MSKTLDQRIAENARRIRKSRGLTQQQVADTARLNGHVISRDNISKIENGSRPAGLKADALAAGIGVDVESLVTGKVSVE